MDPVDRPCHLAVLPDELIWPIALFAPYRDRARLRETCRQWAILLGVPEAWADVARDAKIKSLRCACQNGNLLSAQWLAYTFKLTAEDARADCNSALHHACMNGHLLVA